MSTSHNPAPLDWNYPFYKAEHFLSSAIKPMFFLFYVFSHLNSYVTVDPILCDCLLERSEYQEIGSLKWDDLFSR